MLFLEVQMKLNFLQFDVLNVRIQAQEVRHWFLTLPPPSPCLAPGLFPGRGSPVDGWGGPVDGPDRPIFIRMKSCKNFFYINFS